MDLDREDIAIWTASLGAFALASLLIELTPGPNMAYLAAISAMHGRRAGFAATIGIAFGLALVGLVAAAGVAAIIASSDWLYEALRWAGVAFLLWLAIEGWRDARETSPATAERGHSYASFFTRGFITNVLNPKAAAFYVAVLPRFVEENQPVITQTVTLSLVYVLVATAVHAMIAALAGSARPLLESPARIRRTRKLLSLALAAVAVWFAYATAR